MKLENFDRSWKVRAEVEKFGLKLERITEVEKSLMKLESNDLTWKQSIMLERSI